MGDKNGLSGKNALITGSNRGIGKAIAIAIAERGAGLWVHARTESPEFVEFAGELAEKYEVTVKPVFFDLADVDAVKAALDDIRKEKRSIDILVNNAGVSMTAPLQMSSPDKVRELFEVNFFAPFLITQYVSKIMVRQKSGSIINIASTAGLDGTPGKSAYGASKAALAAMTRSLASELGVFNVRANCIAPGVVDTDILSTLSPEALAETVAATDLGRTGKTREIADLAVFLASDAAAYVTGQIIRADGGM